MKIVGNSCVATFLIEFCFKRELNTPFTWAQLDFDSASKIIEKWDTIDFENYKIEKDEKWNFSVLVDNQVRIRYVHYKFDPSVIGVKKIGGDKFSNRIWEYIANVYDKRTKMMLGSEEDPIFLYSTVHKAEPNYLNESERSVIAELCSKTRFKVIFAYKDISDYEIEKSNDKIEYIRLDKELKSNTLPTSEFIFNKSKILKSI